MNIFCVGADFKTHSVGERERLSLGAEEQALLLSFFARHRSFREFLVLSTCNRTEFYFVTTMAEGKALGELVASLGELRGMPADWMDTAYYFRDEEAARHLFELASGLKSMVVGETEILGQIKDAYGNAKKLKTCGRVFNRLFQSAFAAAKQARTASAIGRGNVSVASVARDLALERLPAGGRRALLVLGTGETGRAVARALTVSGAGNVTCSNRNAATGQKFAAELGAAFVPWGRWRRELAGFDLVVACTAAAEFVLRREDLPADGRRRVLIDLGMPRNIEPASAHADGVTLLNIDHLQTLALQNLRQRARQVEKCRALLSPLVLRFARQIKASRKDAREQRAPEIF